MSSRKLILIVLVISVVLGLVFFLLPAGSLGYKEVATNSIKQSVMREITVGKASLSVEVADEPAKWIQGLSGREKVENGPAMLFIFSDSRVREFWMKDMKFALDFLWLNNGKVVAINENIPPPTVTNPEPVRINPQQSINAVIEVPAGWVSQNGVKVGDIVTGVDIK